MGTGNRMSDAEHSRTAHCPGAARDCIRLTIFLDSSKICSIIESMQASVEKLRFLTSQMSFEPDGEITPSPGVPPAGESCIHKEFFVHPAVMPGGKRIKLLKTLLTSACERDCFYCAFRAGRNFRRATFKPEEFARIFISLAEKGIAEGMFLSSGMIGGGARTEDQLLDTADILRNKLGFRGYLHLKIMPGAEIAQVERAMQLADRVSVNLEAPSSERLSRLAPHKQFLDELLEPLKWIRDIRRNQPSFRGWNGRWPSSVTQFVAGGSGETDLELLKTSQYLYRQLGLKRAYYSRFSPVPDTPMENIEPVPALRELRLYQASFLLRDYGFDYEELVFDSTGQLPLVKDPKLAWAQNNLIEKPMEINRAERRDLLRIPGIGPLRADAILKLRRQMKLRDLAQLKKLGVITDQSAPFLLLDGRQAARQLSLF